MKNKSIIVEERINCQRNTHQSSMKKTSLLLRLFIPRPLQTPFSVAALQNAIRRFRVSISLVLR